jgi:hypothetical protein
MTTPLRLIKSVMTQGATLRLSGGRIVIDSAAPLPVALMNELRTEQAGLVEWLLQQEIAERHAAIEERAALIADGAGVPMAWAEGYARLCLMAPPKAYPTAEWQALVDSAGRFLDTWGAEAARLDWQPLDLFGVHRTAPFRRLDGMGLLPLLAGGSQVRIVALTAAGATLERPSGSRLSFTRPTAAQQAEAIPVWKLLTHKETP